MKNISYDLIEQFRSEAEAKQPEAQRDTQILGRVEDGAYFCALSPDRSNLFAWYPWNRDMQVLQVGAAYGVYCEALSGRVAALDLVDERDENLALVRFRCPSLLKEAGGNVGLLKNLPREGRYDVVLLPEIDEELLRPYQGDVSAFLKDCSVVLRKNGALLLAVDNSDALKYMAGARKEDALFYTDGKRLVELIDSLPFQSVSWYYPLPDRLFAKNIYSDQYQPGDDAFRGIGDSFAEPRYQLCDEAAVYGKLTKADAFRPFAPSYLLVLEGYGAEKEDDQEQSGQQNREQNAERSQAEQETAEAQGTAGAQKAAKAQEAAGHESNLEAQSGKPAQAAPLLADARRDTLPLYVRYNRSRLPQYQIRTEILEERGMRLVQKAALSKEANEHILSFEWKYALLAHQLEQAGRELAILKPSIRRLPDGCFAAQFPFLQGRTLSAELGDMISLGKAPVGKLKDVLEVLMGPGIETCHNLDLVLENVMLLPDGTLCLLDYEWVFEEPLNRNFVKYRILRYWYEAYREALYTYDDLPAFLAEFGIHGEILQDCEAREESFQSFVHGETGAEGNPSYQALEAKFRQPVKMLSDIQADETKLKDFTEWNLRLQDEVEEHKTALKKEREVERLSQNHIRNIEKINRTQQDAIEAMQAELAYLRKHQSLPSRAKRRLIATIDKAAPAGSRARKVIHYGKNTLRHPAKYLKMYCTAAGRNDISGDFNIGGEYAEGGRLYLPACRHQAVPGEQLREAEAEEALRTPLVSIIIPAYNQVAYTYACLRSILAHTDFEETPYEVILADDVSTDATAFIGRYVEGLVISRNQENQGFLKNCNQAAKRAVGKYLLFLNNDTKVTENWLSSLVRLIESDASIGMVGSKLIYPDGRLQEAGGIIWSDGSGWNYGRLDDPAKPEYNYVKDVDYISGAAIMLSRTLWEEIGGFDERFAPAYCEDSDLAFEVRRRGKRVVLQPQSVVVHFEGISNGTDVEGTGLKRYQLVNQQKFREKWARELREQSVNDGNPNPFAARDRSQKKPCVLVIDHYVPTWDRDAGSRTTYQYLRMFLKMGYNVKFLGDNFLHEEPYSSTLQQLGIEILYGEDYQNNIQDWIKRNEGFIDIAYLNRPHIAVKYIDFLKEQTGIKCIYYGHDLHFLRLMREYELNGDIRTKRESDYWKSVEFSVMEQADMVYYPSQNEIDAIHAIRPNLPAKAITAYVWDTFETPHQASGVVGEDYEKREGLLFVGGFAHPPNEDGILWFAEKILPLIRQELPDVTCYIAGSHETEAVKALNGDGIKVLGFVSDEKLLELYHSRKLVVVPLRYGAGVKGKVVEALYHGAVVVTTSVGAEGIPEAAKVMAVTDDNPEDIYEQAAVVEQRFAEDVVKLYRDDAFCTVASRVTQQYIRGQYSMQAAWQIIAPDFAVEKRMKPGKVRRQEQAAADADAAKADGQENSRAEEAQTKREAQ